MRISVTRHVRVGIQHASTCSLSVMNTWWHGVCSNKIELTLKCRDRAKCTYSDSPGLVLACAASFSLFRPGPCSLSEQESGASRRQKAVDPAVHAQGVTKREVPRERAAYRKRNGLYFRRCLSPNFDAFNCPQPTLIPKCMNEGRARRRSSAVTHMPRMR